MTDTTTPTLAPCPFCGSSATQYSRGCLGDARVYAICRVCAMVGPESPTTKGSAAAWNSLAASVARGKAAEDLFFAVQNFFDAYGLDSTTDSYLNTWRNKCVDALAKFRSLESAP